jgi:hypothetical protein
MAGEHAVRRSTRADHPLGDALMVEVGDLLAQVVVLQEGGAAGPPLSEWSVSGSRAPPAVVRYAPDSALESRGAPVGLLVGDTASGPLWSRGAGNGSCATTGSSNVGGAFGSSIVRSGVG